MSKYSIERLAVSESAIKKSLPFEKDLFLEMDFPQESTYTGMKKLLSIKSPPTAVLAISDSSAMGALRAAKEMAFPVPEDVFIVIIRKFTAPSLNRRNKDR